MSPLDPRSDTDPESFHADEQTPTRLPFGDARQAR